MNNAEMLAVLLAMPRLPDHPDETSQEEVDSTVEQLAEARRDAHREPTSDEDDAWLAARWAG